MQHSPTAARIGAAWFALLLLGLAGLAAAAPVDDAPYPELRRAEARLKAQHAARWASFAKAGPTDVQSHMDTGYLQLDLDFDVAQQLVSGVVHYEVKVVGAPLTTAELDLDSAMTVLGVSAGGTPLTFSHPADLLIVTLDRSYAVGESFTLEIVYGGIPDASQGAFGFDSAAGQDLIWSLSEPFGARTWWPCKDTPSDKADSVSIAFTVPTGMIAVSNGSLENVVAGPGTTRYEWTERYPIAPYLVSIAAHPYVEQTVMWNTAAAGPLPVTVWSYAGAASNALAAANSTVSMLQTFEGLFGPWPYPGEKYGQVQFNWGGGMEHQTATSLCCWSYPYLIAHELTHQWFGDKLTCENFQEVWTNEGFATYGEALWREATEGATAYRDEMQQDRYFGGGTIRVPESSLDDFNRIFDSGLSYDKGAWVLHMLRGILGDATFFQFLHDYASDPALEYSTTTTAEVQRVAEATSGLDLQAFFDQWVGQEYYPSYSVTYENVDEGGDWTVQVTLEQLQPNTLFTMPLTLRVETPLGSSDHRVTNDVSPQVFSFPSSEAATGVTVDPNDWVLHTVEHDVESPTFGQGVLLVNGVRWASYGTEIRGAYADSVFTGNHDFEFWDLFTDATSYPAELPAPLGQGPVPASVLGQFSTVVWVGNHYLGDLDPWLDAAILSYLQQGGNVLLLSRLGREFLPPARSSYLGLNFAEKLTNTLGDASAVQPQLVDMARIGTQNASAVFETTFDRPEAVLLFTDPTSFSVSRGIGVWEHPAGGGSLRHSGGHFAFVSGRPYRWEHGALRQNTETILSSLFGEPAAPTAAPSSPTLETRLLSSAPNPFNPRVRIRFSLRRPQRLRLEIFDLRGRRVRTLLDEVRPRGESSAFWDGTDDAGHSVASGVYTVRMRTADGQDRRKITLVR